MTEEKPSPLISTPLAILISAVIISLSILLAGGVISIKGFQTKGLTQNTATTKTGTQEEQSYDKEASISKLAALAKGIGLDGDKLKSCVSSEKNKDEILKDLEDASSVDATGTPTFFIGKFSSGNKINGVKVVGAQPLSVFKTIIDDQLSGKDSSESGEIVEVSLDDDPILGNKSASLTMVEFSDYECPFCKRYFDQTLPEIKKQYVDTGKLKIVYRDLPLSFHDPAATIEALAANCAREQGGDEIYFKMHDEIFKNTKSNGLGV